MTFEQALVSVTDYFQKTHPEAYELLPDPDEAMREDAAAYLESGASSPQEFYEVLNAVESVD